MVVAPNADNQLTGDVEPRTRHGVYPFAMNMALLLKEAGIFELVIDCCQWRR